MFSQVPLQTYLAMLMMNYASSVNALHVLRRGSLNLNPELEKQGHALQEKIRNHDLKELEAELHSQLGHKFTELFVQACTLGHYAMQRTLPEPPVSWQEGSTRLLHFPSGKKNAPAMLCIPSLINRSYILDLSEKRSLVRYLQAQGVDVYLVDWGEPLSNELELGMDDYIAGRVERILAHIGRPVTLLGYCMGGVMALATALRQPEQVKKLILLATPWDFHAPGFARLALPDVAIEVLEQLLSSTVKVPASLIQSMFYYLHPDSVQQKLESFSLLMDGEPGAMDEFLAVEHWVNDGISMTRRVAQSCFIDWAHSNVLLTERWEVGGTIIDPSALATPVLCITGKKDHIVPPASTMPLILRLPAAESIFTDFGHISMMVGHKAPEKVWPLLV